MQTNVRSIFVSDVHLGTSACQARYLLDFITKTSCDTLYLVGDIVDLLAMRKGVHFPLEHQAVIAKILGMAQEGKRVVFIPGNHDALFRRFQGQKIAGIEIRKSADYLSQDGRKFLVSHGDEFDTLMQCSPWLNWLGDISHELLLRINTFVNVIRKAWGRPYWSLARAIKKRIGSAQAFIDQFEDLVSKRANEAGYDGFICGHIHHWQMHYNNHALYINDGDWVEHCSALVETRTGEFQIWHWADTQEILLKETSLQQPSENLDVSLAKTIS